MLATVQVMLLVAAFEVCVWTLADHSKPGRAGVSKRRETIQVVLLLTLFGGGPLLRWIAG